jgi:hypothetical protein
MNLNRACPSVTPAATSGMGELGLRGPYAFLERLDVPSTVLKANHDEILSNWRFGDNVHASVLGFAYLCYTGWN